MIMHIVNQTDKQTYPNSKHFSALLDKYKNETSLSGKFSGACSMVRETKVRVCWGRLDTIWIDNPPTQYFLAVVLWNADPM